MGSDDSILISSYGAYEVGSGQDQDLSSRSRVHPPQNPTQGLSP